MEKVVDKFLRYVKENLNYKKELKDIIKNKMPSNIKKHIKGVLKNNV